MDTTLQDPLVGRELDGRYQVRSRIARGGMATVYLALDTRLDREVALKVMHAHLADDEQFTARFVREARAAARLSHPNVVQVFDQSSDDSLLYLAMEYLRGRTLREVLTERRVLTPREALTVIEPVLDALAAAHRIGIVHRDVKPENVILTDEGRVKVADFGLARAVTANTSTVGVLLGTVAYLAPELVLRGVADTRSDVYAAGIMLFEMLTGRQPFTGDVPIQVAYQHVNEQVPAPSTVAPGLPPALDEAVAAATARSPDDRPDDADEFLVAVRAARTGLTPAELDARPAPPPLPTSPAAPSATGAPGGAPLSTDTETFQMAPGTPQHTRALPELASGHAGHRQATPLAAGLPVGERDDLLPPTGSEEAELAAMLRRRRTIGLSALLTVLGLALVLAVSAWYFSTGPGAYTRTPRLAGLTVDQARAELTRQGLRSTEQDVFNDTAVGGTVVDTDPASGQDVRKDGAVRLKVSRGPARVKVPPVVGKQEADARKALAGAYLTVRDVKQVFDDNVPRGQVMQTDPGDGQQVDNGTPVILTVSKGPKPVDVPYLIGKAQDESEATLASLRLAVRYTEAKNDDDVPAGAVLAQNPRTGTLLPGQTVTLTLSKGPVMVPVPDVVGKQFDQANRILSDAGFQVRRIALFGGIFGTVRFQDPRNGTAPKGSVVTISLV
ncbi:MAG TPA: Stk1 family PASTA domain-containing Ser/Thr kinase [Kineosporiaceae bacterium]